MADDMIAYMFQHHEFNAAHVRRGDWGDKLMGSLDKFLFSLQRNKMNSSLPLFVATDEADLNWFNPLREMGFTLRFAHHFSTHPDFVHLLRAFPLQMHSDVTGFVEQLICAKAGKWIGTEGSTFSFAIEATRSFPPLREVEWKTLASYSQVYSSPSKEGFGDLKTSEVEPLSEADNNDDELFV